MFIRLVHAYPERIIHKIRKDWCVIRETGQLFFVPISRRYWIGILIGEEDDLYLVQTYGFCPDCRKSVYSKFTPKFMKGPKGKLP